MTAATSMVSTKVKETKAPAATHITDTNPYEQHIADSPTKAAQVVAGVSLRLTEPIVFANLHGLSKTPYDSRMKKFDTGFFCGLQM